LIESERLTEKEIELLREHRMRSLQGSAA
jgi:hypothetical protein